MSGNEANVAWVRMLEDVMGRGNECRPRGMRIKELIGYQSVVDMARPVVSVRARKLSRKFLAAEALWILSGDNRVSTIAPYNSAIAKFSDDGVYFNGAYGPRVVDQLSYILDSLVNDHDSRQAVMTIWRSNPRPSKDVPCLDGSTAVWSPEGNLPIRDLAKKFDEGHESYPVFAFDKKTRTVKIAACKNAWKSGVKKRLRLLFDDGSDLILTGDHTVLKKVRRHVEGDPPRSSKTFIEEVIAQELKVGDRLWATTLFRTGPQQRLAFIENLSQNWHRNNQKLVHAAYAEYLWGQIPDEIDVHHKDGNIDNNSQTNLELIPHAEHAALIAAIEELEEDEVYDFTVPGFENAVVGPGVIVHNCTVAVQWFLRKYVDGMDMEHDVIHCVDTMRSSDAWLGWPYDVFNFSMLTALIALMYRERTGNRLILGNLSMNCGSQHVYENNWGLVNSILREGSSIPVQNFDPNEFAGPQDLLDHLAAVRDKKVDEMKTGFLKELI